MSSYLFHNAVVLLAHRRLGLVVGAMKRKRDMTQVTQVGYDPAVTDELVALLGPVAHAAVEDRMFKLAGTAAEMLSGGGAIRVPRRALLGQGTGKFAVMGSIGFELPSMVEYLRPSQGWITEIMRRGSPDPNFSKVIVPTTHFALRVGEIALARAGSSPAKRRAIEAFVMGMLCSIAVEVVTNPLLRGMQAATTPIDWNRFSPETAMAAADASIARDLLGSPGSADWEAWWPTEDEVPDELFDGFDQALREVYGISDPPRGFGDFAATFDPGRRPDKRDLKNAYSLFRHANITVARNWNTCDWWKYLLSMTLPPILGMIIAALLPRAKDLFKTDADLTASGRTLDSRAASEILTTGYLIGIVTPFATTMHLHSLIPGDWDPYFDSILIFVIRAIGIFVFGGFVIADLPALARWLLFGGLVGTDLYSLVRMIIEAGHHRKGPALLYFIQAFPLISMALVGLIALVLRAGRWGIDTWQFWVVVGSAAVVYGVGLGLLVGWLLSRTGGITVFLRNNRPRVPLLDALPTAGGDVPRALAHVFDDATLWRDSQANGQPLATHRYPSGRRALLKLRWIGDGALEINARGSTIIFLKGDGTRTTVNLPEQSVTPRELKTLLEAQLPGLEATLVDEEPQVRLPAPDTLSDPGDVKETFPLHDTHAADFEPVGKTAETAYLLRHAPRQKLTSTVGQRGPSCSPLDSLKLAPQATLHDLDGSALGLAADLASLLCMGATKHLRADLTAQDSTPAQAAVPLTPAYRVLRQWNLDERRMNEWRMVVHGGATTERYLPVGAPPLAFRDEGIRPGAPDSTVPGGEALANAMGWIPLWRAWSRMASDPLADAAAGARLPSTPPVRSAPGVPRPPSNQELSDAIRFLFDLEA